jgi:hypothetical protein
MVSCGKGLDIYHNIPGLATLPDYPSVTFKIREDEGYSGFRLRPRNII